jgi:hypothetical protein
MNQFMQKSLNSTKQISMYDRSPFISTIVTSCQYNSKQVIILRMIELFRLDHESPPNSACGVVELYFICCYVELFI